MLRSGSGHLKHMHYVYLITSKIEKWNYIGYTTNLRERFRAHQKGLSPATRPYRPFELIFYEAYKSRMDAKRREEYFKTNKGKRALKLILKESLSHPLPTQSHHANGQEN